MERLALEAVRALEYSERVHLIGPRGCGVWTASEATEVAHRSAAGFLASGWWAVRWALRGRSPDWAIGGSGLAAPLVISAARRARASAACFVHGLDLVVDHPLYRRWCLPALRSMDLVIANSRNTARLAEDAGIAAETVHVLHPGVQTGVEVSPDPFLSAFPVARGRPLLLSVGRLLPRKGVVELAREVLPSVVAAHPDVLLVVAGGPAPDALLRSADELGRLRRAVAEKGLSDHVLMTGQLSDAILASLYAAARLLVFPVRDLPHDVEGFGMVALEAAARGVPTVAFDAGGVADAVGDGVSGTLVPADDYAQMARWIDRYLGEEECGAGADSCRSFAERFAWPRFGECLRALIAGRLASDRPGRGA
jgi:phosphatidylinositol alpha-1,6-mannosyltransferase